MRQVQQHTPAQDDDVAEPVTLQEGPRTPPTLSPGSTRWDDSFQALICSSPRAMPLFTADSFAFGAPSGGDIATVLPVPLVTANSGPSPSSSSPATSVFDSSGATSVSSWTSSSSSFPAPDDFRSPEGAVRGFSSDPGRVTASVITDAGDSSPTARNSSRSAPDSAFNEQPPLADDFLQADAPLRARRNHRLAHSGTSLHSHHTVDPFLHPQVHRFRTQHVSGSRSAPSLHGPPSAWNPLASPAARDSLLQYAHQLYLPSDAGLPVGLSPVPIDATSSSGPPQSQRQVYTSQLIPLLEGLRAIHPRHVPTLLLYGCVLYAIQDYQGSIEVNEEILSLEPEYVEAMCNMGTTLKALGRLQEAEERWWNAIRIRPVYWDAIENLISTLCSSESSAPPRYDTALALCAYVCAHIAPNHIPDRVMSRLRYSCADEGIFLGLNATQSHPLQLYDVWPRHIHKLQHLVFHAANLRHLLGVEGDAVADHLDILNLSFRPPLSNNMSQDERTKTAAYTTQSVILAACIIGILMTTARDSPVIHTVAMELGLADVSQLALLVSESGQPSHLSAAAAKRVGLIEAVHSSLARIRHALINIGGGLLPTVLLLPSQASKLPRLLFGATMGRLPAVGALHSDVDLRRTTSTILVSLGKIYQEADAFGNALLCFYLAAGLHATPATYNNAGLLLSAIGTRHTALVTDENGHSRVVDGLALARAYYVHGLGMDPQNPHLLTNLGSLMKELGQTAEAVQFYERALRVTPDFHVALANLANAMKDMGRGSEAVNYYRRALEIKPDFAEALCGYVSALNSVCDWRGRGAMSGPVQEHHHARFEPYVDDAGALRWLARDALPSTGRGLMARLSEVCEVQLHLGYSYGFGAMRSVATSHAWIGILETALGHPLVGETRERWKKNIDRFFDANVDRRAKAINEGAFIITLASYLGRIIQRRWFVDAYGAQPFLEDGQSIPIPAANNVTPDHARRYQRLQLPASLGTPPVPSVLPFHAFTYPLSVRTTRLLSYRNGLRITHLALTQPWLSSHVSPPPPPQHRKLNIGYLSGDLNNHPLAHLMQSVFGFHDLTQYSTHTYATSASDGSSYRRKVERDSEHFTDCSGWPTPRIVNKIIEDRIHVLINLGGYTKGCRNDIFAARPAPVQISVMGFAGTLSCGWSDYILTDVVACPPESCAFERWRQRHARGEETSRIQDSLTQLERETDMDVRPDPESLSEDWMYGEKFIYVPHSYFVNDHKQAFCRDDLPHDTALPIRTSDPDLLWALETARRWRLRQVLFPDLHDDTIIFANFNQLYKIDPVIFATWLRILQEVPNSILWLLRFPTTGAENLERTARQWAGESISSRIRFTDVASKSHHIQRGRVADLFLDTPECNAHTTATDILWSGTPILTWPKYKHKLCSRVAASIARATGYGAQMTVGSLAEYQARAIFLAKTRTELLALRKALYFGRDSAPLFDTRAWTRYLEVGIREAWRRWVVGTEFEDSAEWAACDGPERDSSSIWISEDGQIVGPPKNYMQ